MICGDFNMVYDNSLDIVSGEAHDQDMVLRFKKWIDTYNLIDSWRSHNKDSIDFTWSRLNPFVARRLDYIFTSETMSLSLCNSKHLVSSLSDHKIILAFFQINKFKRGPSYWKLNSSILNDSEYIDFMNYNIDTFFESAVSEPIKRFELLKIMVKTKSIEYCTKRNSLLKAKESKLINNLNQLNERIVNGDNSIVTLNEFQKSKNELEIIRLSKTKGAVVRSRAKFIEEGEKNSKYFMNLEKGRGKYNTIDSLRVDNRSSPICDELEILNEIKNYHEDISRSQLISSDIDLKINDYLKDINHAILSEQDKEMCDLELSLEELGIALSSLNNNSAPGIDGLPVSWYKVFYKKIKLPLLQCLNQCILTGQLSTSQRRGVITLIHKGKDLDRHLIKNWRPISVTTTDYKIYSKCIANRLKKILPSIIHTTQSGFVKGRSIADHIRLIDDIINLSKQQNTPGMIVSLDYQKAFDSVEKCSILAALHKFNFGPFFIKLVNTLIHKSESCIQNGGWLSSFFEVKRGIRQGCCASPILFIIVAELMSIKIRNNDNIKGLSFRSGNKESKEIKLLQYADDTTLLLKSKNDLLHAINDVSNFSGISGLKLNEQKSIGMFVGSNVDCTDFPDNISWAKKGDNIKILGIYFNSELEASDIEQNWKVRLKNMEHNIIKLHKKNSSLYGKVLLCKSYLLSQVSFILQTLSLPNHVLDNIDSLLFKFVWQKSFSQKKAREKIKRSVLCKPLIEGGLDMVRCRDQQKVFHLKWMHRIVSDNDSLYKLSELADMFFSPVGGVNYILSSSLISDKFKLTFDFSRFWQDILKTWISYHTKETERTHRDTEILKEPLFNNLHINHKGKAIFYSNWVKADIKFMNDLFREVR